MAQGAERCLRESWPGPEAEKLDSYMLLSCCEGSARCGVAVSCAAARRNRSVPHPNIRERYQHIVHYRLELRPTQVFLESLNDQRFIIFNELDNAVQISRAAGK